MMTVFHIVIKIALLAIGVAMVLFIPENKKKKVTISESPERANDKVTSYRDSVRQFKLKVEKKKAIRQNSLNPYSIMQEMSEPIPPIRTVVPLSNKARRNFIPSRSTLIDTCRSGNHQLLAQLLRTSLDPGIFHNRAIRIATANNHVQIISLLIQDDRVNPGDMRNQAFKLACASGFLDIMLLLLTHSKVDPCDNDNEAFKLACQNGKLDIIGHLLRDTRINPSANDNEALHKAFKNKHFFVVNVLLLDDRILKERMSLKIKAYIQMEKLKSAADKFKKLCK